MKSSTWNERFLATSRGRIVGLLRSTPRTVNDLAMALDLTDNAVRAHLATLERDGLVRQMGQKKGTRKPHGIYALTPSAEELFPKAYDALLGEVLNVLDDRLRPDEVEAVLREVGRRMAATSRDSVKAAPMGRRLDAVLAVLSDLGGQAHLYEEDGRTFIRGDSCPLGAVVGDHPEACRLAETIVSEILGVPVYERCEKGPSPRCCFEIGGSNQAGPAAI